ncbi:MAG: efflux RND transporter periplasmic adaptor subunit [Acidobacteriia bacterium]|nr:efflux RND transporter periplasmic adaptor subunit [Terriglobia bacterium]
MTKDNNTVHFRTCSVFLFTALTALLSTGCGRGSRVSAQATDTSQVKVVEIRGDSQVEIERPEQFPLVTVEQRHAVSELRVTGVVAPDVARSVPVLSLAGGRATAVYSKLGDDVKKGQVLMLINSPDVAQTFSDYQKAQADEVLAQKELTRSQELYAKGAIAQRDLDAAQDAARKTQLDVIAAADRARALGGNLSDPSPIVAVGAPISGTIVEQNVTSGTGVRSLDNSPNLFTVADLSRVWVLCDVYENDLPRVRLGDLAEVRLDAYPGKVFRARVGNISRVLDPATRTAKVRLELSNPGGLMRVGMFVTATFRAQEVDSVPAVPATAVLRLHDQDWVFVPEGGNVFRRIAVQTGPVLKDHWQEVLSGLAPGQQVVANALQFASAAAME